MALYAIIDIVHKIPIAFHNDYDAISQYFDGLGRDHRKYWCGKLGKERAREIRKRREYHELYLVQVGDTFVPAKYYDAMSYVYEDTKYTYNTMIRNLERELEYSDLDKKVRKAIETVIYYLQDKCEAEIIETSHSDYLDQIQELYDEYHHVMDEPEDFPMLKGTINE